MSERKPTGDPARRAPATPGGPPEVAATVSQSQASIQTSRTAAPNPMSNSVETPVPRTFGRYRIERELGKGAMGVVYLALDTQIGRKVALKIPNKSTLAEPDALERFYREARTSGTLRHPNICPVFDVGSIDGTHYLTMAYIPGKPVSSFLGKGKLPQAKQVALLIRKLALALDEAHRQGVVHRDLKPSNVMLDDRNEPIIMDFGLARQMNSVENARLTQSGAILGTPAYMAPEQVRGEVDQIGPASDLYALGVMMYQFLTGELPFGGPIMMVFAQIISNEPKKPSELKPDVDPVLEAICLKMMAKDIGARYAGMKDVAAALTEYVKTGSVSALSSVAASTDTINSVLTEPVFENLAEFPDLARESGKTGVRKTAKPQATGGMENARKWKWLPAILALPGLAALALAIYFRTGEGTVRIEVDDPSIRVTFAGQLITFETEDGAPIIVRAGKQTLSVERDGLKSETLSFTLTRGEEKRLTVTLENGRPVISDPPADPSVPLTEEQAVELTKRVPPALKATPADGWTDLLAAIDVSQHASGRWMKSEDGTLSGFGGGPKHVRSRVLPPIKPAGSYEVELRFQLGPIPADEVVLVNLPVGDREVTFGFFPSKPKRTRLYCIEGRTIREQRKTDNTIHREFALLAATTYQLNVSVSVAGDQADVLISLDGAPWVSWKGPIAHLSRAKGWNVPQQNALGLEISVPTDKKGLASIILTALRYRQLAGGTATSQNSPPPAAALRVVDLLKLVDPERDGVKGAWTRSPDGLASDGSVPFCRLQLPYRPPAEYDFRIEFTAQGGHDILQILSAGNRSFTWLMGAWGGQWDGFDAVAGHPLTREGTGIIGGRTSIRRNVRHTSVIQVRKDFVAALIDGKQVVKHPTDFSDLGIPDPWKIGSGVLGLGTTFDPTVFHRIEVAEISGAGTVTAAAAAPPDAILQSNRTPPPADRDSTGWQSLFPMRDLSGWVGKPGVWTLENGELVGKLPGTGHTYLAGRSPWKDFELSCQVRLIGKDANAGIQFRSQLADPGLFSMSGPQCEIGGTGKTGWSGLWWAQPKQGRVVCAVTEATWRKLVRPDDFNELTLRCVGRNVTVTLNGTKTVDGNYFDPSPGLLGWQLVSYGSPAELRVRNPRIRELKSDGTPVVESTEPPSAVAPFDAKQARAHQVAWAKHLGVPVEWENSLGMKFMLIPPGEFLMGSSPAQIAELLQHPRYKDWMANWLQSESPAQTVRIDEPYYLGRHELTVGQFRRFVEATGYKSFAERNGGGNGWDAAANKHRQQPQLNWNQGDAARSENLPARYLAPADALAFLKWLSEATGVDYALPSEAQWEFACRAGTTASWPSGDDEAVAKELAWVANNTVQKVGAKPANPFGLHDMLGNLVEFALGDNNRVARRGGDTYSEPFLARSASRQPVDAIPYQADGFRAAITGDLQQVLTAEPVSAAAATPPVAEAKAPEPKIDADGFVVLFDGTSRAGWKHWGLNGQGDYAAIGGVLKKEKSQTDLGLLAHHREFSNFILRLDYRLSHLDDKARVYFRLRPHGKRPPSQALAVSLVDNRSKQRPKKNYGDKSNGALLDLAAPERPADISFGEWHALEVRAVGPKVAVRLDRKTVLDVNLKQIKGLDSDSPAFNESGVIGVQVFKGASEFRNIRIQPLDDKGKPL